MQVSTTRRRRRWLAAIVAPLAGCATAPPPSAPPPTAPVNAAASASDAAGAPLAAASAPDAIDPARPPDFVRWLDGLRSAARAAGIDEATLRDLDGVRLLPRVIDQDRAQPEFNRTVWDYLDSAVSPQRVATGQDKLAALRETGDAVQARYGVAPPVIVAIWGIESAYGRNYGDIPTLDALATLGFDGRREAWARGQLIAALKILQRGDIAREQMIGSWAGAMGQTQFLPTVFLDNAVDADGDGRCDIWNSLPDVMASTANFLVRSGWRGELPWGTEVRLPAGFDVGRADPQLRQPTAAWVAEGVLPLDGAPPLPELPDAAILLPAGARGPAFLVGANFRALLRYNNSTSYALAVGLLAQRLAGGAGVQAAWPRDLVALTRTQMTALQSALNARGYASGEADGMMGPATRDAIRRWQRSVGLPADGYPTLEMLQRLQPP